MKEPKLQPHQFMVLQAEFATGKVLKIDKTRYLTTDINAELYLIFESKEEGLKYMNQTIEEDNNIECVMWNSKKEHIITIDKDGERVYPENT